ncbi:MAG: hypothetical protein JXR26_09450 [Balneolaceae bacterium]|nr:hypothetical protein [Balneolaceae bacterium]
MKKFIFAIILILLVALFAFHFVAANQAEKQIDKAIQEQVKASPSALSVQYSSIEVSPFSGGILFNDITIVEGSNIERTQRMNVDLRYLDFLNIYLGGVESGLKKLEEGNLNLSRVSFVNRESLQEFSVDTLNIDYNGNMWDALQSLFTEKPTDYSHQIYFRGINSRYKKPESSIGNFTADTAYFQFHLPKGTTQWRKDGTHKIMFKNISWAPPVSFQNKYGFFIQGFGYALNAIPIDSLGGIYSMPNPSQVNLTDGVASTDLFNATFSGTVQTDSTWNSGAFTPLRISLVDLSEQFTNILTNIEQLLGITLPGKTNDNEIHFQLVGPVTNPQMQPAK